MHVASLRGKQPDAAPHLRKRTQSALLARDLAQARDFFQATLDSLMRRVTIGDGSITLPAIGISESGYIVIPHHNKFGHDYTDPPDDGGVYPAVRK